MPQSVASRSIKQEGTSRVGISVRVRKRGGEYASNPGATHRNTANRSSSGVILGVRRPGRNFLYGGIRGPSGRINCACCSGGRNIAVVANLHKVYELAY